MSEVIVGGIYQHCDGGLYRVDFVDRSTDTYEKTHQIGDYRVSYTQLTPGSCPAGTPWNKSELEFSGMTNKDGIQIPIFTFVCHTINPAPHGKVDTIVFV